MPIDRVDEASRPLNVLRRSNGLCICISTSFYLRPYVAGFKYWYAITIGGIGAKERRQGMGGSPPDRGQRVQKRWPPHRHRDETKHSLSVTYATSGAGV